MNRIKKIFISGNILFAFFWIVFHCNWTIYDKNLTHENTDYLIHVFPGGFHLFWVFLFSQAIFLSLALSKVLEKSSSAVSYLKCFNFTAFLFSTFNYVNYEFYAYQIKKIGGAEFIESGGFPGRIFYENSLFIACIFFVLIALSNFIDKEGRADDLRKPGNGSASGLPVVIIFTNIIFMIYNEWGILLIIFFFLLQWFTLNFWLEFLKGKHNHFLVKILFIVLNSFLIAYLFNYLIGFSSYGFWFMYLIVKFGFGVLRFFNVKMGLLFRYRKYFLVGFVGLVIGFVACINTLDLSYYKTFGQVEILEPRTIEQARFIHSQRKEMAFEFERKYLNELKKLNKEELRIETSYGGKYYQDYNSALEISTFYLSKIKRQNDTLGFVFSNRCDYVQGYFLLSSAHFAAMGLCLPTTFESLLIAPSTLDKDAQYEELWQY